MVEQSDTRGDHAVRFYYDDQTLLTTAARHVAEGMKAGGAGFAITTPGHAQVFRDALYAQGIQLDRALADGQLVLTDAHEAIDRFIIADTCDRNRFLPLVEQWVHRLLARHRRIHAFAEMVDVLCGNSQHDAMLDLEGLWNEIVAEEPIDLLCGYRLDCFSHGRDETLFDQVCAAHRRVYPAEDRHIHDDDAKRRIVAELEQHTLALHSEIDDRARLERDLRRLLDEFGEARATTRSLAAANEELKHFASVCAHDLREPLRMVTKFLDLFIRRYGAGIDQAGREMIRFAVDGAHRMEDLIDGLLRYAASEAGLKQGQVDLDVVLDDVLRTLGPAIIEAGGLVRRARLPTVRGDRSALHRVLQNLVDNALKFRGDHPPVVDITFGQTADAWLITVSDNGIGMESADQERAFGEFERLGSAGGTRGSGLGLSICRRIIEKHGGRIWIDGAPGRGTSVHFTIPRDAPPPPHPPAQGTPASGSPT